MNIITVKLLLKIIIEYFHYVILQQIVINNNVYIDLFYSKCKQTQKHNSNWFSAFKNAETLQNLKRSVTECTFFIMCFVLETQKQDVQPPLCCLCLRSNYMWYRCQNDAEDTHGSQCEQTEMFIFVYLCVHERMKYECLQNRLNVFAVSIWFTLKQA